MKDIWRVFSKERNQRKEEKYYFSRGKYLNRGKYLRESAWLLEYELNYIITFIFISFWTKRQLTESILIRTRKINCRFFSVSQ